jgi:hypothetical protein
MRIENVYIFYKLDWFLRVVLHVQLFRNMKICGASCNMEIEILILYCHLVQRKFALPLQYQILI